MEKVGQWWDDETSTYVEDERSTSEWTARKALEEIFKFRAEIGCLEVAPNRVVMQAVLISRELTYTFTGATEEMELIYRSLLHYVVVRSQRGNLVTDQIAGAVAAVQDSNEFKATERLWRGQTCPIHWFNTNQYSLLADQLLTACIVLAAGCRLENDQIKALPGIEVVKIVLDYWDERESADCVPLADRFLDRLIEAGV